MTKSKIHQMRERWGDPLLTILTFLFAILLFIIGPAQAAGIVGAHYFGIVFGVVLVAAVFVVSGSYLAVGVILVAVMLTIVATLLRLRGPAVIDIYLEASAWMLASCTLGYVVARAVFARGKVNYHRVIGAVLLYLNIGLFFVALYCFVALLVSPAFSGLDKLVDNLAVVGNLTYFSFVTLTSVGYGDIVPLHPMLRGIANVEAIIGQLYPATLLARLVTLELEDRSKS